MAVVDKVFFFEYTLVAVADDGDARALVDDVGKKGVGASHGDNTAVDIGAACDDLISGLKQDLLPQQDLLLLFTVVIC